MRNLLTSLIISFAVIAMASPSFARDDHEDREWDRDKKEQRHHKKKERDNHNKHPGNPFKKIKEQLDDLNDKLDELLVMGVDLRGVTQNWDKKLDSTNGEADGCNSDRFTCVLDGQAVRDNETGLVWERSPDTSTASWYQAILNCSSRREVGGRKGWELPMRNQLASLIDTTGTSGLTLPDGHPFQNVQSSSYWTATTNTNFPLFAVDVIFGNGIVGDGLQKSQSLHTWCVRGGQSYDGQDVLNAVSAP